jgi:hypothetical protein
VLGWMTDQLKALGVAFAATPYCPITPSATGSAHQPWASLPFSRLPTSPRKFPAALGLAISTNLLNRLRAGPVVFQPGQPAAVYAPANLVDYLVGVNARPGITVYPM